MPVVSSGNEPDQTAGTSMLLSSLSARADTRGDVQMTNRLLISVAAAALIAGTGLANAQGMSKEQPSSGGATTQHSAPSGGAPSGAMDRDSGGMKGTEHSTKGESSGTKGAESEKGQPGASGKSAQDTAPGEKSKSTEHETKGSKEMKAEDRDKSGGTAQTKGGAETKGTAETKSQTTTGAATAGPPAEKRTEITSAIKSEQIEEATNVDVNLSVGTTVPSTVRFHPLPPRNEEIHAEA